MGKNNMAFQYLATTGAGIVIGTNIDFGGVYRTSDLAGTVTIKDGATTILTMSADRALLLDTPVALSGSATMTSSAGQSFVVLFRKRST